MAYRESSRVYPDELEDDAYRTTTVRRYKVTPSRVDRVEVEEDEARGAYGHPARGSSDLLDPRDRDRGYPERPRSAFDTRGDYDSYRDRDRDRDPYRDGRPAYYEREVERERERERDTYSPRGGDWDRRSRHWDHHPEDSDVRVEKRVERREDGDVRVEKRVEERHEDHHGGPEIERYRKETEYYSPLSPPPVPQPPLVIRQAAQEPQKIIVQDPPAPAPVVVSRDNPGVMVVRDREQPREVARRDSRDDEYYYRRETRELAPYRRDEREYAMERRDRRDRDRDREYSDDEDYWVRRKTVTRERSPSPDNHRRHLAGGALAGAGVAAILASRRGGDGELQANRGRKVLAGAALGALGTEGFKRARSAYEDRWGDNRSRSRHRRDETFIDRFRRSSRSRSRSSSRSKIKTGLGVAAAALAIAGAAKYYQNHKIEKEEASRGRSRTRYPGRNGSSSLSRSRSRSRRRSRSKSVAKAAAATAATTGIIQHFRNKSRGQSRSKSRLRQGAEVVAAGLAGGAASKLWNSRKDKKEGERDRDRNLSDEEYEEDLRRERARARRRSRSRSQARSFHSDPSAADRELGMVEYGNDPLPPTRRSRRRRSSFDDYSSDASEDNGRKRSRSRLRNMAAAAVGTGAAAIGIKEYKKKKDRERERERERSLSVDPDYESDRAPRRRNRDRDRRRFEDEPPADPYYDDYGRPPSPLHASGGAYYPPAAGAGFPQQNPNFSNPSVNEPYPPYPQYNGPPNDFAGYPPPHPGMPPAASGGATGFPPPTPGGPPVGPAGGPPPPTATGRQGADHVSDDTFRAAPPFQDNAPERDAPPAATRHEDGIKWRRQTRKFRPRSGSTSSSSTSTQANETQTTDPQAASKSVKWGPLSPKSAVTLELHRQHQQEDGEGGNPPTIGPAEGVDTNTHAISEAQLATLRLPHTRRRSSDPTSNRPVARQHSTRHTSSLNPEEEIEMLPDRFDAQGRPLNPDARYSAPRPRQRSGSFEYRPQHPGDWDVRGSWATVGMEGQAAERLMGDVEGLLSGRMGWGDVIRDVMGSVQQPNRRIDDDDDYDYDGGNRRRRRRKRRD